MHDWTMHAAVLQRGGLAGPANGKASATLEKLQCLCDYVVHLGLRNPTERTEAVVATSVCMQLTHAELREQHPLLTILLTCKAHLRTAVRSSTTNSALAVVLFLAGSGGGSSCEHPRCGGSAHGRSALLGDRFGPRAVDSTALNEPLCGGSQRPVGLEEGAAVVRVFSSAPWIRALRASEPTHAGARLPAHSMWRPRE